MENPVHDLFPSLFICCRTSDFGGLLGAKKTDSTCEEAVCVKCAQFVVTSQAGREFLKTNPLPIVCYPCAMHMGFSDTRETVRTRDQQTGIPRIKVSLDRKQ